MKRQASEQEMDKLKQKLHRAVREVHVLRSWAEANYHEDREEIVRLRNWAVKKKREARGLQQELVKERALRKKAESLEQERDEALHSLRELQLEYARQSTAAEQLLKEQDKASMEYGVDGLKCELAALKRSFSQCHECHRKLTLDERTICARCEGKIQAARETSDRKLAEERRRRKKADSKRDGPELWILEAQLVGGSWKRCPGWHDTEKDAQHEIVNRSVGRYHILYRPQRYVGEGKHDACRAVRGEERQT